MLITLINSHSGQQVTLAPVQLQYDAMEGSPDVSVCVETTDSDDSNLLFTVMFDTSDDYDMGTTASSGTGKFNGLIVNCSFHYELYHSCLKQKLDDKCYLSLFYDVHFVIKIFITFRLHTSWSHCYRFWYCWLSSLCRHSYN